MSKTIRWISWIVAAVSLLALVARYLNVWQWPTIFFGYVMPRQDKVDTLLKIVGGIAAIISSIDIVVRLFKKPPSTLKAEDTLLTPITLDEIRGSILPYDPSTPWFDRGIVQVEDFSRFPVLILAGGMKCGKNAEAYHLIERGIQRGEIQTGCMFDISGWRNDISTDLKSYLNQKLTSPHTLLFLDQLPYPCSTKDIEKLTCFVEAVRNCDRAHLVTTLRSDLLEKDALLQHWLNGYLQNDTAAVFDNKPLSETQSRELVEQLITQYQIEVSPEGKRILVEESDAAFPYQLILMFQKYQQQAGRSIPDEEVRQDVSQSLQDIWVSIRENLQKQEPAVRSLLEAISIFHYSAVEPYQELVFALAGTLERKKQWGWIPRRTGRKLKLAAGLLAHYGVTYQSPFTYPEVALPAGLEPETARQRLAEFLMSYKRLLARPTLRRFHPHWSVQRDALMELGGAYYYQGDVERAESLCRKVIASDEKYERAWSNLGLILHNQGKFSMAELALRQAIALNKMYAPAWYNLGLVLRDLGYLAESEAAYREATIVDETFASAWHNLAVLLSEQGKLDEAVGAYRKATTTDEKNGVAWYNMGVSLNMQGKLDEAVGAFRKAIAVNDKDANAWFNLGQLLHKQGKLDEAAVSYHNTIAVDETYAHAWNGLGVVYEKQGRVGDAEDAYRKAVAADEKLTQAWFNLGVLFDRQGRVEEAELSYSKAIIVDEKYAPAWNNLAALLVEQREFEKARAAFEKSIELGPNQTNSHFSLSLVYRELGLREDARRELTTARRLYANETIYNQARIRAVSGEFELALTLLDKALDNRNCTIYDVLTDPDWKDWLTDPRFLAVIQKHSAASSPAGADPTG